VCILLCTIVAHNIARNKPDNFPSYPPWRTETGPKLIQYRFVSDSPERPPAMTVRSSCVVRVATVRIDGRSLDIEHRRLLYVISHRVTSSLAAAA